MYLSPEAQKAKEDAAIRRRLYWPRLVYENGEFRVYHAVNGSTRDMRTLAGVMRNLHWKWHGSPSERYFAAPASFGIARAFVLAFRRSKLVSGYDAFRARFYDAWHHQWYCTVEESAFQILKGLDALQPPESGT